MTKITGAQVHIMTNKYTKFENDSLKNEQVMLRTKLDRRTDVPTFWVYGLFVLQKIKRNSP